MPRSKLSPFSGSTLMFGSDVPGGRRACEQQLLEIRMAIAASVVGDDAHRARSACRPAPTSPVKAVRRDPVAGGVGQRRRVDRRHGAGDHGRHVVAGRRLGRHPVRVESGPADHAKLARQIPLVLDEDADVANDASGTRARKRQCGGCRGATGSGRRSPRDHARRATRCPPGTSAWSSRPARLRFDPIDGEPGRQDVARREKECTPGHRCRASTPAARCSLLISAGRR